MRALLLDGSTDEDALTPAAVAALSSALSGRGAEVSPVRAAALAVAPCAGCFGCWTRTPGECVIADDARRVVRRARERTDRVERRRERHRAVQAHESVGRLESGDSAE